MHEAACAKHILSKWTLCVGPQEDNDEGAALDALTNPVRSAVLSFTAAAAVASAAARKATRRQLRDVGEAALSAKPM